MMKKAIGTVLIVFFIGCGKTTLDDHLKNGKNYLSLGDGRHAEEEFRKVIAEDPSNCTANYGLLLASALNFTEIISLASGALSGLTPQENTGTDALVESILESLVSSSISIQNAIKVIEENGCRYYHPGIPVKIGENLFYAIGEWGLTEAELIAGVADLIAGVFHLLESQNYDFDINGLVKIIGERYSTPEDLMEDPLQLIRLIGYIPYSSPQFLKLKEERKSMWDLGRNELGSALSRIKGAIDSLFSPPQDGDCIYDNILMWEDKDHDGKLSPSDTLDIKLYTYDPLATEKKFKIRPSDEWRCDGKPVYVGCLKIMEDMCFSDPLVQTFLLSIINQEFVDRVEELIGLFANAITGTYSDPITIGIINTILPPGLKDGLSFGNLNIPPLYIKNTVRFHIKEFFDNPVSFRDLLPYYYDEDEDGIPEFLIEMERGKYANIKGSFVFKGDTSHFPERIEFIRYKDYPQRKEVKVGIRPDGIAPPDNGILIYIALQDPSINGLLEFNLHEVFPNWPDAWTDVRNLSDESDRQFIFNAFLADILKYIQELLNAITQTL